MDADFAGLEGAGVVVVAVAVVASALGDTAVGRAALGGAGVAFTDGVLLSVSCSADRVPRAASCPTFKGSSSSEYGQASLLFMSVGSKTCEAH